jgi:hypothetical protein
MNLGRSHIAALAACCIALALSGCGDDSPSTASTADSAETTSESATEQTGAAKKKAEAKAKEKSTAKKSSDEESDRVTAYNNPTVETTAEDQSVMPAAQKAAVRKAFNRNIEALREGDVDYLCNTAYSKEFVQLLEKKGGCEAATSKQVAGITSYKSKVTAIARYPNSNLIVVYADFKFKNATGAHESKGGIYFKTQGGQWKRAVPPGP